MAGTKWTMHWEETKVFDVNAVALGFEEIELMNSAGESLAREALASLPGKSPRGEIWFICGPGNNGGDGFVAAQAFSRMVSVNDGLIVRVFATHEEQKSIVSRIARARNSDYKFPIHVWNSGRWTGNVPSDRRVLLIVDCMLGVGQGSPGKESKPRGLILEVMEWLHARFEVESPRILACDVPTGLGSSMALNAGRTLTFHSEKMGLLDEGGKPLPGVGGVKVADLPWPVETTDPGPGDLSRYPLPLPDARKGDRGRVLVVGGGPYHGAPLLSAMAAARVGADLIHVAMPSKAGERVEWPLDIIREELPDDEYLSKQSIAVLKQRLEQGRGVQSIVIGPGLGKAEETLDAVRELLVIAASKRIPTVIDADAIAALPKKTWPTDLIGVVTPHVNEFKDWLADVPAHVVMNAYQEYSMNRRYSADEENSVIVCTGAIDELFGLNDRHAICDGGSANMAMGGTGDVLAGAIGGLLAIGMSPWAASRLATWMMRRAGEFAEKELGPGMLASDIPIYLAKVLAQRVET